MLIRGLDKRVEVDVRCVGVRLAFPIIHVVQVDAGMRQQINNVRQ
jgi:hypothetical protein